MSRAYVFDAYGTLFDARRPGATSCGVWLRSRPIFRIVATSIFGR